MISTPCKWIRAADERAVTATVGGLSSWGGIWPRDLDLIASGVVSAGKDEKLAKSTVSG